MEKVAFNKKDNDLLKINYMKALKNSDFKKLAETLDIPIEIQMKYTSRLMDSSVELKNCSDCPGLVNCKNKIKGFKLTPTIEKEAITFSYLKCKYKEKNDEANKFLENVNYYEVPPVLKTACFKNIYRDDKNRLEIIKKIKKFYDNYKSGIETKGIYLNGNFGSGKSYLIAALFNELAKLNYKSSIIYFPEFLSRLKSNFGRTEGNEYKELLESVKKIPLLLIDDIGAEKLTDWARDEILGSILQYRMDFKLPTFFTSNLTILELESHLQISKSSNDKVNARRIIERIKYLGEEVTLIGINRRSE